MKTFLHYEERLPWWVIQTLRQEISGEFYEEIQSLQERDRQFLVKTPAPLLLSLGFSKKRRGIPENKVSLVLRQPSIRKELFWLEQEHRHEHKGRGSRG
jgi:hypothetical protein